MGPLGWPDVEAYKRLAAPNLTGWQAECLVRMSRAFSSAASRYDGKLEPAPFGDDGAFERAMERRLAAGLEG
ncbi:MAG: hypothetical protein AAFR68_04085 [Pseudomonadota bacterium]